jgi:hypothetical protein
MGTPRPLGASEARGSLVHRLAHRADRLRQIATRLGLRPYRVFLTWTRWSSDERGVGSQKVVKRVEILPTPKVMSMDSINLNLHGGGLLPEGSVRVSKISCYEYDEALLKGTWDREGEQKIPEPYEFFYEIVEDGRSGCEEERKRFRILAGPHRDAGGVQWELMLARASEDL